MKELINLQLMMFALIIIGLILKKTKVIGKEGQKSMTNLVIDLILPCNIIFSFIFPVNESIWEHMKILFTSTLIYSLIEYIILKKYNITYNNLPFNTYFIPLMQIPLYLVIYIPLYKLLGESPFISITLMIIVYIIGQIVSYNILKEKELKVLNTLSVPIIIIIYLGFIYLTYNPPHKFIFYDILNEKYGINEYKKITKYR